MRTYILDTFNAHKAEAAAGGILVDHVAVHGTTAVVSFRATYRGRESPANPGRLTGTAVFENNTWKISRATPSAPSAPTTAHRVRRAPPSERSSHGHSSKGARQAAPWGIGNHTGIPRRPTAVNRSGIRALAALTIALVATAGLLLAGEGVAAASCAAPLAVDGAIKRADVVVVGTVTATRSRGRIATVHIDDLWKGHLGGKFEVFGGPASDNTMTTVDRTYEVGKRYLLFAYEPAAHGYPSTFGGRYEDNSCSDTQPWTSALRKYRPAGARTIHHETRSTQPSPSLQRAGKAAHDGRPWIVVVALALAFAGIISVVVRHRRRPITKRV